MQNFKLMFAMMHAVMALQLQASSEKTSTTCQGIAFAAATGSPRPRTSSKERMEEMKKQQEEKASSPRYKLAETIRFFQNSQIQPILRNVQPQGKPEIQARYNAIYGLSCMLGGCRSDLESPSKQLEEEEFMTLTRSVHDRLIAYKTGSTKIEHVIHSSQFKALQTKCSEILGEYHV